MYKINSKSVEVKFDRNGFWDTDTERKTKALAIFLGGYNKYGRELDTTKVASIETKFYGSLYELSELLK